MKSNKLQLILGLARRAGLVGLALGLGLSNPSASTAQEAGAAITGSVQLPPAPPKRRASRGDAYRNRLAPSRGGSAATPERSPYADVVVSAHPLSFEAPVKALPEAARVEQVNAEFVPHVQAITVGTAVEFVNQDRFFHNVFSLAPKFDIGRKPTGQVVAQTFDEPGAVQIFCDIHPQMSATIVVLDTPWYAQPDSTGSYRIGQLPAGRYRLRAYHPEHEALEIEAAVAAGQARAQDFAFRAR